MGKSTSSTASSKAASTAARKPARDDPARSRARRLDVGSEEEIGRLITVVVKVEGDGYAPVYTEGAFREYRRATGLWPTIPDHELHRIVGSYDGSTYPQGKQTRKLQVSDAFARGALRRAAVRVAAPDFFAAGAPVLAFSNGVVRVTADGKIELLKHSPDHHARAGYAFAFNRTARRAATRFLKMMREHFEGDLDADDKIACLQEFFGACLLGLATKFQKCLALPSDGGGGRSTLLAIIEAAMPAGSVSHVEAKELRSAERRAKLPAKLLNYSDEVPPDAFLESEDFKKVVVGNIVSAEEKYRPSYEFRPIAGFVFPIQIGAAAELSDAFFRRFLIVRYNRNFEGAAKRDYDLAATIIATELPGVVAWMIEGAARLLKQGHYTVPASHVAEEAKWKLTADTVRAFLDAAYTKATFAEPRTRGYDPTGKPNGQKIKPHDWTPSSSLYTHYRDWCETNGHRRPVAVQEFARRVDKIGYPLAHTHKGNFYGVRPLDKAQREANERAKSTGTPPEALKGAVSVLQGATKLKLVENLST
jgi:phage/plasmid-associated DNA primase